MFRFSRRNRLLGHDIFSWKLEAIASEAQKLGIEMFVLDDGWFGKRDDDYSGLVDWKVNEAKVCLTELVQTVTVWV